MKVFVVLIAIYISSASAENATVYQPLQEYIERAALCRYSKTRPCNVTGPFDPRSLFLEKILVSHSRSLQTAGVDVLKRSHVIQDVIFRHAYGNRYSSRAAVFKELYTSLNTYFALGYIETSLDSIFDKLYHSILADVGRNASSCTPDLPSVLQSWYGRVNGEQELTNELWRALQNTRFFIISLSRIAQSLIDSQWYVGVKNCHYMAREAKLCRELCPKAVESCTLPYTMVNDQWNELIESWTNFIKDLKDRTNMDSLLASLPVALSASFMDFYEELFMARGKLSQVCSLHSPGCPDSETASTEAGLSPTYHFEPEQCPNITELLRQFQDHLQSTKDFWKFLPQAICSTAASNATTCSNTTRIDTEEDLPLHASMVAKLLANMADITYHINRVLEGSFFDWEMELPLAKPQLNEEDFPFDSYKAKYLSTELERISNFTVNNTRVQHELLLKDLSQACTPNCSGDRLSNVNFPTDPDKNYKTSGAIPSVLPSWTLLLIAATLFL